MIERRRFLADCTRLALLFSTPKLAAAAGASRHNRRTITMFLCGDVMTGRGIDQALPHSGRLTRLEMAPFRTRRFRLDAVAGPDAEWLAERMNRECERFGGRVALTEAGRLRSLGR